MADDDTGALRLQKSCVYPQEESRAELSNREQLGESRQAYKLKQSGGALLFLD